MDQIVTPGLAPTRSYAIGFVLHGKRYFFGYGTVTPNGAAVDERSLFETGSIGKLFVGTVLAEMVLEGKVALEDPVLKFLPPSVTVPQKDGKKITLLDLATHHSGLPVEIPDPSVQDERGLMKALGSIPLDSTPGTTYLYSNLGAALLGFALAGVQGTTWYQMERDRVFAPLGMVDTGTELPNGGASRWVQSYQDGQATTPTPNNATDPEGPSGGDFTDAFDMTRFLAGQIGLVGSLPPAALSLARKPERPSQQGQRIGLFWDLDLDQQGNVTFYSKGGAWNGFYSHIEISTSVPVGVVVLGNHFGETDASDSQAFADRIMTALLAL
jgi:CubicO group peptidase (beta-lactamase class C family)